MKPVGAGEPALDRICVQLLGVSLSTIKKVF